MNDEAKAFRDKYCSILRRTTLSQNDIEIRKKKLLETLENRKRTINSDRKMSEENQR